MQRQRQRGSKAYRAAGALALAIGALLCLFGQPSGDSRANAAETLPQKNLSFMKNIGPLLVEKCGRCHVANSRGKFSMATFDALKKGTPDGPVIVPGKSSASRMIEVLDSGEMPKGGQKLSKAEIAAISKWIDEGAKFDGPDPMASLAKLGPGLAASKADQPKLDIAAPSGKETISFAKDIAPVLAANCVGCHGAMQAGGQFRMDSFREMIKGGQNGNAWKPGDPSDSLIVQKLKGMAGARMPLRKPPLSADLISKFEKWISEGATFDGPNPAQSTETLAAITRAKTETNDELSADRREEAQHKWRLADPGDKPISKETKNFFLIGNVSQSVLDEAAEAAEAQAVSIARQFRAGADQPLVKGRITLFLFPNHYQYSEFGQMVEDRQLPAQWRGHWKYDIVDAYGVVMTPAGGTDYSLAEIIGQQAASVYAASLAGKPPEWFSQGVGMAHAARVNGRAARVREWNDRLNQLFAAKGIEGFINNKLGPEDNNIAAYGFVKDLMAASGKFSSLLTSLRGGEEFETAFVRVYGGTPQQIAPVWAKSAKPL